MGSAAASILVVDDEERVRGACEQTLRGAGYRTIPRSGSNALHGVGGLSFDVALVALETAGGPPSTLLDDLRGERPEVEIIALLGRLSVESALEAVRLGATGLLSRPPDPDTLLRLVGEAIERKAWSLRPLPFPPADPATSNPSRTWLCYEGAGRVRVGLEPAFVHGAPGDAPLLYIEPPRLDAVLGRGDTLLRLLDRDGRVWTATSPVGGRVRRVNVPVLADPDALGGGGAWVVELDVQHPSGPPPVPDGPGKPEPEKGQRS